MTNNIGYPNYDTTSYDTPTRRHHQKYTSTEKNNYQHHSSSPTPSNVSEAFYQSIMDLFEENY